uniref:Putative secreted protein n=1 Tax=Ixodes ricinus TaxID=34613 RepID=A0A6B0TTR3_IXORI
MTLIILAYVALFTLPKVYETYKVSDSAGLCVGCGLEGTHLHAPSSRNMECGCCYELCAVQTRVVGLCGT